MPFTFKRLDINDVILVTPKVFGDARGFFWSLIKNQHFLKTVLMWNLIRITIQNPLRVF